MKENESKLRKRIDKALKLLESFKLGKYDYSLSPRGLIELELILRGVDNERRKEK